MEEIGFAITSDSGNLLLFDIDELSPQSSSLLAFPRTSMFGIFNSTSTTGIPIDDDPGKVVKKKVKCSVQTIPYLE